MLNASSIMRGLLLATMVCLSSCFAGSKTDQTTLALKSSTSTSAMTGLDAFKTTFYPFARTNCASCHGVSQAPLFAISSSDSAYPIAKDAAYVNFGNPSASKLAIFSGNGHCGLPGCVGNSGAATTQIQAWAAAELAATINQGGTSSGAHVTNSLAIPPNLPTAVTYVPMRWQLSGLNPVSALVSGALFELEIQKLSSTTYRVRNPKIVGLTSIVKVTGIHVFIKASSDVGIGVEDLGAGSVWENDVVNIPATTLPGTLPATPLSSTTFVPLDPYSMIIGIRSNQDSLTIVFDKLEVGN